MSILQEASRDILISNLIYDWHQHDRVSDRVEAKKDRRSTMIRDDYWDLQDVAIQDVRIMSYTICPVTDRARRSCRSSQEYTRDFPRYAEIPVCLNFTSELYNTGGCVVCEE